MTGYYYELFKITALYSQSGRVAVITGGNRGLGLYIVDKLLKCDFVVIMGEF